MSPAARRWAFLIAGAGLVALIFLFIGGPYLTHATVRAIRARDQASEPGPEQAR